MGRKSKTVRFSGKDTFYSPPTPITPSLSFGSLSPASSGGPITPPSYSGNLPGPTPYVILHDKQHRAPPPPPLYRGPPRLHPLLQFSHSPAINFDLTQHPEYITTHHRGISQRALAEPATQPPVHTMRITSPHLPWVVTVPATHAPFVTVYDVLATLYSTLRTGITPADFHALPTERDRRHVKRAYEERYRRIRDSREYADEKRGGVRRVDFLMDHTRFMGLAPAPSSRSPDAWILHVDVI